MAFLRLDAGTHTIASSTGAVRVLHTQGTITYPTGVTGSAGVVLMNGESITVATSGHISLEY